MRCAIKMIPPLLFILSGAPCVALGQGTALDTAIVRTVGTAHRSVRPDQASIALKFSAEGETPLEAGQHLSLRTDSLRRTLGKLGIPRDSLVTASRWWWWSDRIQTFTRPQCLPPSAGRECTWVIDTFFVAGRVSSTKPRLDTLYRASENIEVHLGDPSLVGAVIDAALAMRITDISNIRFSASDTREAQASALREATTNAREQAEAIASAIGCRLGRVLWLSTQPDPSGYSYSLGGVSVSSRGTAESGETIVTAPSVVVTVSVYGRWQVLTR